MMKTHAKIQKWGNGLALRISGIMREVPHLKEGSKVDIEVTEAGFTVTKSKRQNRFPYKEAELLKGLSPEKAHTDLLALPLSHEIEQE
jgi:antitoxin MazE